MSLDVTEISQQGSSSSTDASVLCITSFVTVLTSSEKILEIFYANTTNCYKLTLSLHFSSSLCIVISIFSSLIRAFFYLTISYNSPFFDYLTYLKSSISSLDHQPTRFILLFQLFLVIFLVSTCFLMGNLLSVFVKILDFTGFSGMIIGVDSRFWRGAVWKG